jgi:hypothetical protein
MHQQGSQGTLLLICQEDGNLTFTAERADCNPLPSTVRNTKKGISVTVVVLVKNQDLNASIQYAINASGVPPSQIQTTTTRYPNGTVAVAFTTSNVSTNFTTNILSAMKSFSSALSVVTVHIQFISFLTVFAQQPIWQIAVILALFFFFVLLFYCTNRYMNPNAKNLIVVTLLCSTGHVITICFFLRWLNGLISTFPKIRVYFWASVASLVLTIVLNTMTNIWVLCNAMRDREIAIHVTTHILPTTMIVLLAACNCALMGLLNSGLFGWWTLSAPVPDHIDRQFSLAGILSNIFKDLPQLLIQALVMVELQSVNDGLYALVFSGVSLAFAFGKRAYIVASSQSKRIGPELDIELPETKK